ncbi:hypothetical protein DFH27DRAFT_653572 [Peziza echinospora]|nr:hypothetical protein DFH27DRAFT_653572 [Peziza echinospora]
MMDLLVTDDVGEVKIINTSIHIDTTNKESARPKTTSFFEPTPKNPIVGICHLPPSTKQPSPPVFPPKKSAIFPPRYVAILRNPGGIEVVDFVGGAERIRASELCGEARQPDVLWSGAGKEEFGGGGDGEEWVGFRIEGEVLYAWTAGGRIDFWGGEWRGGGAGGPERHWVAQAPKQAVGINVAEVRVQPYDVSAQQGLPKRIVVAVGYSTEKGEVEVFEAKIAETKEAVLPLTSIFKSKTPRPNALKLAIPSGVSAICWLPTPPVPPPMSAEAVVVVAPGTNRWAKNKPEEGEERGAENLFFATATPFGHIRLYQTAVSRRPVFYGPLLTRGGAAALRRGVGTSVTKLGGDGGIVTLTYLPPVEMDEDSDDDDEEEENSDEEATTEKPKEEETKKQTMMKPLTFIFSDENARLGVYTLKPLPPSPVTPAWKGRMTQLLPGDITGIIRAVSVYTHPAHMHPSLLLSHPISITSGRSPVLIATTGLDRYLRIYQSPRRDGRGTLELVSRVYIGTRGNGVLWVGGKEVAGEVFEDERGRRMREGQRRREEREREVDEVWGGIEGGTVVGGGGKSNGKKASTTNTTRAADSDDEGLLDDDEDEDVEMESGDEIELSDGSEDFGDLEMDEDEDDVSEEGEGDDDDGADSEEEGMEVGGYEDEDDSEDETPPPPAPPPPASKKKAAAVGKKGAAAAKSKKQAVKGGNKKKRN